MPSISDGQTAETTLETLRQVEGTIAARVGPDCHVLVDSDRERIREAERIGVLVLVAIQTARQTGPTPMRSLRG